MAEKAQSWGSRIGLILAVAGSAVGLGNFLRFPGRVAEHGGGAFMIPYIAALLCLGIPIGWAEWSMARYGGRRGFHSCPGILGVAGRGRAMRYLGVLGVVIPLIVYFYYLLIESWCLGYCIEYLRGGIQIPNGVPPKEQVAAATGFLASFTGMGADGAAFDGLNLGLVVFLAVFAVNSVLVYRGLSGGIEAFCRIAMPLMAACAVIVLVRVLSLGTPDPDHPDRSVVNGLGYMWNPDFSKLGKFDAWLSAAAQIFFSLSVGFGVIINYASYVRRKQDIALTSLTASSTNELFEVGFGGLITIPAAFVFMGAAIGTLGVTGSSFGLGFRTLPVVFAHMDGGSIFGALWFFMLFLAAITSSLSMLQPVLAFLEEAAGLTRRQGTIILSAISLVGCLVVMYFSRDLLALDTVDRVAEVLIFLLATVQIICFGWILGVDRGFAELRQSAQIRVPEFMKFVMRYVAPVYLLAVFTGYCLQSLGGHWSTWTGSTAGLLSLLLVALTAAFLIFVLRIGERRWRAAGRDLDGLRPPADE